LGSPPKKKGVTLEKKSPLLSEIAGAKLYLRPDRCKVKGLVKNILKGLERRDGKKPMNQKGGKHERLMFPKQKASCVRRKVEKNSGKKDRFEI